MTMKKVLILSLGVLIVMSSCGTYEGAGAYTGAHFGSIIGSAIGGITGGWRGSDVGSLIGLAGGAVVGAAIGKAADEKVEARAAERYERHRQANAQRNAQWNGERRDYDDDDSGFDPAGRGDDRIFLDGMSGGPVPDAASAPVALEIRNAHFMDTSRDGYLTRGETARVVFEIYNPSPRAVYGVQPSVLEVTGNKHIFISENVLVESILPNQSIRYTAQVKTDKRLKDGQAVFRVSVFQRGREITSQSRDFRVKTTRR